MLNTRFPSLAISILATIGCALARDKATPTNTGSGHDPSPTVFPAAVFGFGHDLDNVQVSVMSVLPDEQGAVLSLMCGSGKKSKSENCYLKPSPTLTLGQSLYRLNLGTVFTQTCSPTGSEGPLTVICTQSSSGKDSSSVTTTYSSSMINYITATVTAGADLLDTPTAGLSTATGISSMVTTSSSSSNDAAATTSSSQPSAAATSSSSSMPLATSSSSSSISSSASPSPTNGAVGQPRPVGLWSVAVGAAFLGVLHL